MMRRLAFALLAALAPSLALAGAPASSAVATGGGAATPVFPPYISGSWSAPLPLGAPAAFSLTANRIFCAPSFFTSPVTITQLGTRITNAATAGTNLSLLYYSDFAGANGHRPGLLLASVSGLASTSAVGTVLSGAASATFAAGTRYWGCVWSDGNPAIPGQIQGGFTPALFGLDSTSSGLTNWPANTSAGLVGYYLSQTYSTTPPSDLTGTAAASWVLQAGSAVVPFLPQ